MKNNWVIFNIGGSGIIIFYVIGIMLMFVVLYFYKKNCILWINFIELDRLLC